MQADASKHKHDGFISTQVAARWPGAERAEGESGGRKQSTDVEIGIKETEGKRERERERKE